MRIKDKTYCDFCKKQLYFDGYSSDYENVMMPVLYSSRYADSELIRDFDSSSAALAEIKSETHPDTVGFHYFDLCRACALKMVNVCIVDVPARSDVVRRRYSNHTGNQIAILRDDLQDVTKIVDAAMEAQSKHTCDSCIYRLKKESQVRGFSYETETIIEEKCLHSENDLQRTFTYYVRPGLEKLGCPYWKLDNHLGRPLPDDPEEDNENEEQER